MTMTTTTPTITLTVRGYWATPDGPNRCGTRQAACLTDAILWLQAWHGTDSNLSVDLFEGRSDGTGACLLQLTVDGNVSGPLAPIFI